MPRSARHELTDTVLILGGAGMVGLQAAREVARELSPKTIVITSLREAEIIEASACLKEEISGPRLAGEWGNIFVPEALRGSSRDEPRRASGTKMLPHSPARRAPLISSFRHALASMISASRSEVMTIVFGLSSRATSRAACKPTIPAPPRMRTVSVSSCRAERGISGTTAAREVSYVAVPPLIPRFARDKLHDD